MGIEAELSSDIATALWSTAGNSLELAQVKETLEQVHETLCELARKSRNPEVAGEGTDALPADKALD